MSNQELITNAIANMSNEEKALDLPTNHKKELCSKKVVARTKPNNNIRQQQKSSRNIQSRYHT